MISLAKLRLVRGRQSRVRLVNRRCVESSSRTEMNFLKWFQSYVKDLNEANDPRCTPDIHCLARTPSRWFMVVSALLMMAHTYRGIELCRSLSLPPLS
ncbi:hypothetical protein Taro_053613 [Colocasia esculenta]|uniref:Uncharacterized protein n=1 Tax=Colocasia esculenta TaxID=4460 RepID=A0A843XLQ7_COLES|nr:hypothetical protein [Colocasia esculenta]